MIRMFSALLIALTWAFTSKHYGEPFTFFEIAVILHLAWIALEQI